MEVGKLPFLRSPLFLIICFFVLVVSLHGCGGGGSAGSGSLAPSPEDAVRSLVADWPKTGGPVLTISPATASGTASTSQPVGFLRYKDFFSQEEWLFQIDRVEYPVVDKADVHASYYYKDVSVGELVIIFHMIRVPGGWSLDGADITSLPAAVVTATGIQGFIIDKVTRQAVSGALVSLWSDQTQVSSTTSGLDGFYRFLGIAPGTYTIVISRKGFTDQTISNIPVK